MFHMHISEYTRILSNRRRTEFIELYILIDGMTVHATKIKKIKKNFLEKNQKFENQHHVRTSRYWNIAHAHSLMLQ
jgi:hypothetical protein